MAFCAALGAPSKRINVPGTGSIAQPPPLPLASYATLGRPGLPRHGRIPGQNERRVRWTGTCAALRHGLRVGRAEGGALRTLQRTIGLLRLHRCRVSGRRDAPYFRLRGGHGLGRVDQAGCLRR